jgi:hypothetical protein
MGAKLQSTLMRSRVERDLQLGDLRVLSDFAFFRNRYPPSIVVDRLCERGFLAKNRARAHPDDHEGLDRHTSQTYFGVKDAKRNN